MNYRNVSVVILIFSVVNLAAWTVLSSPRNSERLTVAATDIPENVRIGDDTTFHVEVHNSSDRSIQILEASATCGCTSVNAPKRKIPRGGSCVISGIIKSRQRPGQVDTRLAIRYVVGGESATNLLDIPISVDVVPAIRIRPIPSDSVSGKVLVTNLTDAPLIVDASILQPHNFAKLAPHRVTMQPDQSVFVDVSVSAKNEHPIQGLIRFSLAHTPEVHSVPLQYVFAHIETTAASE